MVEYEKKLHENMLTSCIEILDELINGELMCVNHFEKSSTGKTELEAHRPGILHFPILTLLNNK